jgi:hypothetical protein
MAEGVGDESSADYRSGVGSSSRFESRERSALSNSAYFMSVPFTARRRALQIVGCSRCQVSNPLGRVEAQHGTLSTPNVKFGGAHTWSVFLGKRRNLLEIDFDFSLFKIIKFVEMLRSMIKGNVIRKFSSASTPRVT